MKVLVAMSGGVDSSVAAAMLTEQGHDVTGVHLRLADLHGPAADGRVHGCCGVTDADDARRVAQVLDIPFYVWSMKEEFERGVVDDLVSEYAAGRTPNPCVRCNEVIKFGVLLRRAESLGFDALATGHYATRRDDDDGRARLFRGADVGKDQSYVLSRIRQDELRQAVFPVGVQSKAETRELARQVSLRVADKPDSYEICFVPDGDTAGFVEDAIGGPTPGAIVDEAGEVLGEHDGIHRFTVGQRRGLGLATHERTYVVDVDVERNQVIVGPDEMLSRSGLVAADVRWTGGEAPDAIETVQIRAHGTPIPSSLGEMTPEGITVSFDRPERGIAPGQLVAFYSGDEVLGGGTISRSVR